jgi:Leucine-rich repeat (LRR) protein
MKSSDSLKLLVINFKKHFMKHFIIIFIAVLWSLSAQAQIDKSGQQFLDSLGIKYDVNDPDALLKAEQALKDLFLSRYDSAMKVASDEVIDPYQTQRLAGEILNEFGEGDDTTSTTFEYMQDLPFLLINLDHPDPRFLTEYGFELPSNLNLLFITGNSKAIPIDLVALFTKLNSRNISELYLIRDKEGISEIPKEIGNLKNLKILGLYGNNLSQLPASIGDLTQLEELYVDVNPIHQLPASINALKNLKILGIANTLISAEEQAHIQNQLPNCKILLK